MDTFMRYGVYKFGINYLLKSLLQRVGFGLLVVVFFISGHPPPTYRDIYKSRDSLAPYIYRLYEITDEEPQYYIFKTDSLLATLWRQPQKAHEHIAYLDFILLHAYYLQQAGLIPRSTKWYEQGLNYLQQHRKVNYEAEEYIYKPLGNNYVRLGDYDKAIALQQRAIQEAVAKKLPHLLSSLYSNLAITYFWLQQYDSVQLHCNRGIHYLPFNNQVTGLLYNIKTEAFLETGLSDSAKIYNQRALAFHQSTQAVEVEPAWKASTLVLTAKLLKAEKKYASALQRIMRAEAMLQQFYPQSHFRDKAKVLLEKGSLWLLLNSPHKSIGCFREALSYFTKNDRYFPDHTVSELYNGIAESYTHLKSDSCLYYYQLAAENDYFTNQLISSSLNSLSSLAADALMHQRAVTAFKNKYRQTGDAQYLMKLLWLVELSKGRKLLNEMRRSQNWSNEGLPRGVADLLKEIRYDYLLLAEETNPAQKQVIENRIRQQELQLGLQENRFSELLQPPSFALFAHKIGQLAAQNSIISYAVIDDSLLILSLWGNNADMMVIPSLQAEVNTFIDQWFQNLGNRYNNEPQAYFAAAAALRHKLLNLRLKQKIVLSADAYLHRLPFEALVKKQQIFLGQEHEISYVYSLMQYHQSSEDATQTSFPVKVFTFQDAHLGFNALPQSVEEGKMLKKQMGAQVYPATELSTSVLLQHLQQPAVMHFATHAVANDSITQPFLVFAQKFYLGQLQYIVTRAPLVVLTACETAAGNLQNGEGVMSLGRAFISKGVKGVVASRWQVDDAVAPTLMKYFYTSLKNMQSPSAALFEARKNYLSQAALLQKNPWLWAGLAYIGLEQQIKLSHASSSSWYIYSLWLLLPLAYRIHQRMRTKLRLKK